jgi:phosphatidylglycerol:prolipoprotein diacylglycerol transferase
MTLGFLFTFLGYATGAVVFWWRAHELRRATEGFALVAGAAFVGGIAGAKLSQWLVAAPQMLLANPALLADASAGGRALVGGILGGWLAVRLARQKLGLTQPTGDLFALALPAGEAVGRIGCFFNQCCYGVPSVGGWTCYQHGAARFPVQIFMALSAAAIFGWLCARRNHITRTGELFDWYLVLFGISRFALEFWRERDNAFAGLSLAQWVCLALAAWGMTRLRSALQTTGATA